MITNDKTGVIDIQRKKNFQCQKKFFAQKNLKPLNGVGDP